MNMEDPSYGFWMHLDRCHWFASTSIPARHPVATRLAHPLAFETRHMDVPQVPCDGTASSTSAWTSLVEHATRIRDLHLRQLLQDEARSRLLCIDGALEGVRLDASRQLVTQETASLLLQLAEEVHLRRKMEAMHEGMAVNATEGRPALHTLLRAPKGASLRGPSDLEKKLVDVHAVLERVERLSESIRNGVWKGHTGQVLKDVVVVGIGGSYLGPLFVHTAMKNHPRCAQCAKGRRLRFLANVDPIDYARAVEGLEPSTTLVVVVSKTFTTAETMLNARTLRHWITKHMGAEAVKKHMVAVSTNLKLVEEFGIDPDHACGFWDWVGGRFSVCSAVGMLPLALQYGFEVCREFLDGAHDADEHFRKAEFSRNVPVMMGLYSIWNANFLGYPARAILPYSQALEKFPPHIQQLSMESNGKSVTVDGQPMSYETGEIDFGEPGTNGQHSFYQLLHQGRIVLCEFIGVANSQQPVNLEGETVSNHDELMCNFFAQPDALACGKTAEELRASGVPEELIPHKVFAGNRPSMSILLKDLSPFRIGQLLSIYEARVVVQGFVWGINSFDQWGVELGKVLASKIRKTMHEVRSSGKTLEKGAYNPSTTASIQAYMQFCT